MNSYNQILFKRLIKSKENRGILELSQGGIGKGFTKEGHKTVLQNMYQMNRFELNELLTQACLTAQERNQADPFIYNALCVRVTRSLQDLMDAIAHYCESKHPTNIETDKIYFQTYVFSGDNWKVIDTQSKIIKAYQYNGLSFWEYSNKLKHQFPWVGLISYNEITLSKDILDENHIGYLTLLEKVNAHVDKMLNSL